MSGTLTRDQFVTEICDVVKKATASLSISSAELQTRVQSRYLNWGQLRIARLYSFHELNTIQESAATVDGVKRYPMVTGTNNLGMVRPKDISSIRLIDGENSRTLVRWKQRKFDKRFSRPENFSEGRSTIYVRWGNSVELFRIPDDAYTLHIRYPQWPTSFSTGTQTSDYDDKDDLILLAGTLETFLALQETALARIWNDRFLVSFTEAVRAEGDVDWEPEAEPFEGGEGYMGSEYWLDPYGTELDPLYGYSE